MYLNGLFEYDAVYIINDNHRTRVLLFSCLLLTSSSSSRFMYDNPKSFETILSASLFPEMKEFGLERWLYVSSTPVLGLRRPKEKQGFLIGTEDESDCVFCLRPNESRLAKLC